MKRPVLFLIFAGVTIILWRIIAGPDPDLKKEPKFDHSPLLAYNFAEDWVKERLKAPKTADFPPIREQAAHTVQIDSNTYKINSYVDSQNSFGAMLRQKFTCTIRFEGNDVVLKELTFIE